MGVCTVQSRAKSVRRSCDLLLNYHHLDLRDLVSSPSGDGETKINCCTGKVSGGRIVGTVCGPRPTFCGHPRSVGPWVWLARATDRARTTPACGGSTRPQLRTTRSLAEPRLHVRFVTDAATLAVACRRCCCRHRRHRCRRQLGCGACGSARRRRATHSTVAAATAAAAAAAAATATAEDAAIARRPRRRSPGREHDLVRVRARARARARV